VNITRRIVIRQVAVSVGTEETIAPEETTNITVYGFNSGTMRLKEVPANWRVTATDPSGLKTTPSSDALPYETASNDTLGAVFGTVGFPTYELTVVPNETGNYTMRAEAFQGESKASHEFTVEVQNRTEHESGVSGALYESVTGVDQQLQRQDVLGLITAYVTNGEFNGLALERSDVLALINYYVNSGS
jgi:hypothetical protein